MGTGLGPESYAIIEQGRIGQILSTSRRPPRRHRRSRRHRQVQDQARLAEAKLESAKQNLTRVFDILEEVGRQVNSLKRQASKAKRYEELQGELDAHLRAALAGRFRMLEREAAKLALDLNVAARRYSRALRAGRTSKERAHAQAREACYRTEAELTAARQRLAELQLEAERTRGAAGIASQARSAPSRSA